MSTLGKLIHLGAGVDLKPRPWINIDEINFTGVPNHFNYLCHDLRNGLPEHLNEVGFVYSSHFFEHLHHKDAIKLLSQCREKMLPGAVMRVCVPDFHLTAKAYLAGDKEFFKGISYAAPKGRMMDYINYSLYQYNNTENEHKCMYDAEFLIQTLEESGFLNAKVVPYDRTIDPDCDLREHFSLVVEGYNV
jgi:predicted SAM-dependent methyltransferase